MRGKGLENLEGQRDGRGEHFGGGDTRVVGTGTVEGVKLVDCKFHGISVKRFALTFLSHVRDPRTLMNKLTDW